MKLYCDPDTECSICMDDIYITQNYTKTECGHCFHTTCLMSNVSHNGFNCPNCRTYLSSNLHESDSEHDDDYHDDGDELYGYENGYQHTYSQEYVSNSEQGDAIFSEEKNENYIMRGLRFFNNIIHGIQHDEDDVQDENNDIQYSRELENANTSIDARLPSPEKIAEYMIRRNISYIDLIQVILNEQHRDYIHNTDYYNKACDVFGKIKSLIHHHVRELEVGSES
jgi:hypothetical protein